MVVISLISVRPTEACTAAVGGIYTPLNVQCCTSDQILNIMSLPLKKLGQGAGTNNKAFYPPPF